MDSGRDSGYGVRSEVIEMLTFLPYADFGLSARCLDRKRLGRQRVECLQILRTLRGVSTGWRNHPAVKMWQGCENTLALYGL